MWPIPLYYILVIDKIQELFSYSSYTLHTDGQGFVNIIVQLGIWLCEVMLIFPVSFIISIFRT